MEELITNSFEEVDDGSAILGLVHAPLAPEARALGILVAETLNQHPAREVFEKLGVFGCVSKTTKIAEEDKTKLVASGVLKADSTMLQDVSLCITKGAAESAAAATVAARAMGGLSGFAAPMPGVYYVISPISKDRAVFVPATQGPVTLHVLHAPGPLTVRYARLKPGDVAKDWNERMCSLKPIWWSKPGPCGQVTFPGSANEYMLKSLKLTTMTLREGDTLVMHPGTPLWFDGVPGTILHSTTFCRVPEGNPNMESAAAEWHRWHRFRGICDPGPEFRGGAPFFVTKGLPPFTGEPMFESDKTLVFGVDIPALQTCKPAKITGTETELLFWIGFVHKFMGAFQLLEPALWSTDFEQKHREHLTDWLNFFQRPEGKIKHVTKTSTVRSALGTLCDTIEKLATRVFYYKEWVPRFETVAPQLLLDAIAGGLKFPNGTELETRRKETVRQIRELYKVGNWPKIFQHGKDNVIQPTVEEAEALIKADPNKWPEDPVVWLQLKRRGLDDFRGDPVVPAHKIDELEIMIGRAESDPESADCLAIDRAFYEVNCLFDPECGPYISPKAALAAAAAAAATTVRKQPKKKRSRSNSPDNGGGGENDGGDDDDQDGVDSIEIGDDDSELPLGTVVRDILARKWNGSVSSAKTACTNCSEKSVPLATSYCVGCCQDDLHTLISRSLLAGLTILQKRGGAAADQDTFKERIKALQRKERKNEHVFDSAHGRSEQAKVFKELLDEFAALERDFAAKGIVLAEHEDAQDLEEYGDASAMSCSSSEGEGEDEDEEEEEEEEESSSSEESYESSRRRRKLQKTEPTDAGALAVDLIRFRRERGLFVAPMDEMEKHCLIGEEENVAAARTRLAVLKKLPAQWYVEIQGKGDDEPQMAESLGYFETKDEAEKALNIYKLMHRYLLVGGAVKFSVKEKKNEGQ